MSVAYVDSSCFVAIAFAERGATNIARRLDTYDRLIASNLLEAELRSAFARERLIFDSTLLDRVGWVMPLNPLGAEMERALGFGYLRGADLWHIACALSIVTSTGEMTFLTLDERQRAVAGSLGFAT